MPCADSKNAVEADACPLLEQRNAAGILMHSAVLARSCIWYYKTPQKVVRRRLTRMAEVKSERGRVAKARAVAKVAPAAGQRTVALRIAEGMGLLTGPKTKHFNAKVSPLLFQAAAKRVGTTSPAAVINAALASLATEDEVGPWLARNWGILVDTPSELLDQIDL
jgi:hypothetical protein